MQILIGYAKMDTITDKLNRYTYITQLKQINPQFNQNLTSTKTSHVQCVVDGHHQIIRGRESPEQSTVASNITWSSWEKEHRSQIKKHKIWGIRVRKSY